MAMQSSPSRLIRPVTWQLDVRSVRRLRLRRKVVLPPPEGPMVDVEGRGAVIVVAQVERLGGQGAAIASGGSPLDQHRRNGQTDGHDQEQQRCGEAVLHHRLAIQHRPVRGCEDRVVQ